MTRGLEPLVHRANGREDSLRRLGLLGPARRCGSREGDRCSVLDSHPRQAGAFPADSERSVAGAAALRMDDDRAAALEDCARGDDRLFVALAATDRKRAGLRQEGLE